MEAVATSGVLCRLKNVQNRDTIRLLFPKLISMNFDQPEAQLFFGHQNNQSCSQCRRRRFRSAFRKGTPQVGTIVQRLYEIANGTNLQFRDMAKAKLKRWGFNCDRRCCLPTICDNLLLRLPGRDDVFPCVDFRDTLHALDVFLVGQLMESYDYIPFSAAQRRTLDHRLTILAARRFLRDPDGKCYRKAKSIFSDVGMSAMDRIQLLCFLPHIFGPTGGDTILPHSSLYVPLMTAIARTQLIIIASRRLRVYKQSELRDIFDQGYLVIFGCLQRVRQISYRLRVQRHEQHPSQNKKPKELLGRRDPVPDESDTSDTDDDCDLRGFDYSHGNLSLIHQHWVLQVMLAGSFSVHSTQSAESAHKKSAKLAASRVRHLQGGQTLRNMTNYLCYHTVFEHLKDFFPDPPRAPVSDVTYGVKVILPPLMEDDGPFTTQRYQRTFLHEEIPVTRVEFMDMLCEEFVLPKTLTTYTAFERLSFLFAQKFTSSSGENYWATDTRYSYPNIFGGHLRRDRLFIKGSVMHTYRLHDGRRVDRRDALCAEVTCFVRVSGLSALTIPAMNPVDTPFREEFRKACHKDSITFFLVRWFEPHPDSHERDDLHRPICPGPLHINHCLWRYAKTPTVRQSLPRSASSWTSDQKHAYYGLIFPHNVLNKVDMTPCFLNGSTDTGNTWLESVTLL